MQAVLNALLAFCAVSPATQCACRKLTRVGARVVVHTPQFNGKQGVTLRLWRFASLRCPRNGQRPNHPIQLSHPVPLGALNKRLGRP